MKFIDSFANFLVKNQVIEEERKEIYTYGLNQLIVYFYNLITIIVIGLLFKMLWQAMAFTLFYMIIRPYAGGYHARTPKMCYFLSLIVMIAVLVSIKIMPFSVIVYLLMYIFSSIVILKLSPVEDENKPLDSLEVVVFRKKAIGAYILLSLLCLLFWFFKLIELLICAILALFVLSIMLILGEIKNRKIKNIK